MDVAGKNVVVTGAGSGLGASLCRRAAAAGAATVTVTDLDLESAQAVADEVGGLAIQLDVTDEDAVAGVIDSCRERNGSIDIYFSNAGAPGHGGLEQPNELFRRMYEINFMSQLYAARYLMPVWEAEKTGHFVITSSAGGLLTNIHQLPYGISKHASVALGEWLATRYGGEGVAVSVVCPRAMRTKMWNESPAAQNSVFTRGLLEPDEAADIVLEGVKNEDFLIFTHSFVKDYLESKHRDIQAWFAETRELQSIKQ